MLDYLISSIVEDGDIDTWWVFSYEEARMIAKNYKILWKGTMMVKYRTVIGMLGQVGERQVSVWNILEDKDIVEELQRNDLIGKALFIMMVHYRTSFIKLMKQWRKDPEDYIKQYERHN